MNPQSSTLFYHLAYARAEARDIDNAVSAAHTALELDPQNIEAWHLLALLLTAQRDWQGAAKAVQVGIETWEQVEEEMARRSAVPQSAVPPVDPSLQQKDFAESTSARISAVPTTTPTSRDAQYPWILLASSGVTPLPPSPSDQLSTPLSPSRRLAKVIQLRMTQAAIVEKLEGPGAAMWRQQDTFSYFSARSGYSRPGGAEASASIRSSSLKDLGESYIAVPQGPANLAETVICE